MTDNKISVKAIKVALLGDSSVGKTAICNSLMNIEFSQDMLSTIGSDKLETKFPLKNGNEIKLILWDTAGQERFRSVALKAIKAVQGIVVVFDVTVRKSFENIDSWLEEIKNNFTNPSLVLFGNKVDMDKEKWEVTKEEVEQYAKKMNLQYFETSAKTKKGLNEGFSYIVNESYNKIGGNPDGIKIDEEEEWEIVNGCFGKKKRRKNGDIKVRGKKIPKPILNWYNCGLNDTITKILEMRNIINPFPIQMQTIPIIMSGNDCIGIAETGSGKTLAYILPMLRHILAQRKLNENEGPIALILVPTRELACQIFEEINIFTKYLKINVSCVYGGSAMGNQINELRRGVEIAVATPGRFIEILSLSKGKIFNLQRVRKNKFFNYIIFFFQNNVLKKNIIFLK